MRVVNKTRSIVLSENASFAESFLKRLRGLMFSKPSDIVLVSPKEDVLSSSIHMFFMSYPIDVIWVNAEGFVVDFKKKVKPSSMLKPSTFKLIRPQKPAKYVIELGEGSVRESAVGDEVVFL